MTTLGKDGGGGGFVLAYEQVRGRFLEFLRQAGEFPAELVEQLGQGGAGDQRPFQVALTHNPPKRFAQTNADLHWLYESL